MKNHGQYVKLFIAIISLLSSVQLLAEPAEEKPQVGFVRIVYVGSFWEENLMLKNEPIFLEIDGKNLAPEGYKFGQKTGSMGFVAGRHEVVARLGKFKIPHAKKVFSLEEGESKTLIVSLIQGKKRDEFSLKIQELMPALQSIKLQKSSENSITVLSFCKEKIFLKVVYNQKEISPFSEYSFGETSVVSAGKSGSRVVDVIGGESRKSLCSFQTEEIGNYVVLIFPCSKKESENKEALWFYDPELSVAQ